MDIFDRLKNLDAAELHLSRAIESYEDMKMTCEHLYSALDEIECEREYLIQTELPDVKPVPMKCGIIQF